MSSQTIEEQFDRVEEFNSPLDAAEPNAATIWEEKFTADLYANFQRYSPRMFLSESQHTTLERTANQQEQQPVTAQTTATIAEELVDDLAEELSSNITSIAAGSLGRDLLQALLQEVRALPDVWQKASEQRQAIVIERIRGTAERTVEHAVKLIPAGKRPAIDGILEPVAIKEGVKATFKVNQFNLLRHDLIDRTGKVYMLMVADATEYLEGVGAIQSDPDQNPLTPEGGGDVDGIGAQDSLYIEAISHIIDTRRVSISELRRYLKIGHNRAARIVEELEAADVISASDPNDERGVILQSSSKPEKDLLSSAIESGATTYGSHTIGDITVMVLRKDEITPGWLQSRFTPTTEEVECVILQLLDQGVIVLEQENEESRELNIYRVTKKSGDIALDLE